MSDPFFFVCLFSRKKQKSYKRKEDMIPVLNFRENESEGFGEGDFMSNGISESEEREREDEEEVFFGDEDDALLFF